MRSPTLRRAAAIIASATLVLTACGDGDDDTTDAAAATDDGATDGDGDATGDAAPEPVVVTAVDYAYQGLPAEAAVGTTFRLENRSDGEVHEILAVKLADGEERPAGELLTQPEEDVIAMFVSGLRGVGMAFPASFDGEVPFPAEFTVPEPGRYLFVCALPTGGPPQEIADAVAAFVAAGMPEGKAPDYPETGPPHIAQGMFADVTITAA